MPRFVSARAVFCAAVSVTFVVSDGISSPVKAESAAAQSTATSISVDRETASNLDAVLMSRFADAFGGAALDEANKVVHVYFSPDNLTAEDATKILAITIDDLITRQRSAVTAPSRDLVENPEFRVDLTPSSHTYLWYDALSAKVVSGNANGLPASVTAPKIIEIGDTSAWSSSSSKRVNGLSNDYINQQLVVGVVDASPADVDLAASTFGNQVHIESTSPNQSSSRPNDIAPHYAGAKMYNTSTGVLCSSGFATTAKSNGAQKMLGAAHCGNIGSSWLDGTHTSSFGSIENEAAACPSSPNSAACHDTSVFGGSTYNAKMYIGGTTSNTSVFIHDKIVPGPATVVNASGYATGVTGGYSVPVDTSTSCQYYSNSARWFCGLRTINNIPGNTIWGPGDSGGAVYQTQSANYLAVGIISGRNDSGTNFFYMPIDTGLGDFGLVLKTA